MCGYGCSGSMSELAAWYVCLVLKSPLDYIIMYICSEVWRVGAWVCGYICTYVSLRVTVGAHAHVCCSTITVLLYAVNSPAMFCALDHPLPSPSPPVYGDPW